MRCLFVLFFCLILDAAYGDAAPWRQVNAASSSSDDKSFFYLNNGNSYECNPVYRKGTYSFADGAELQTLYGDNYKCVKGWPDEWQKQQTNWCEKSQITTLSVSGARYCVYQDGAEQRCRVQGGNFVEDGAWPRGCLMASCDGNRFFADGKCQERKCGDSPEGTVLENQECAPNVITDSNAASCTKTCTYKENPNRMVWVNSISECKQNYRPSDDKRSCVRTIGPGDNCAANDLPQFATAGKYNSGLKCVATKCKAGTYLVVSSGGASQGWCVAASYCQSVKKMDAEYKLTIIDGEKTDLTCVAPVPEEDAPSDAENTSTPTQETVTDTAVVAGPVEDGDSASTTDDGVTSPTNVQDTTVVSGDEAVVDEVVATPVVNPQVNSLQAQQESQDNIDKLKDSAKSAKDREQSDANKLLGAAGIGATGIGGMMLVSGAAEQDADADAENAMRAYLATFTCSYGNGKNVRGGDVDVELPGGNDLIALYAEYVALANDLKARKEALGMRPGIESEPILNAATSGLYDDVAIGKTGGAYASLARALADPNSQDAKMWQEQKDETAEKKKTGAITAGIGAAGSLVGGLIIDSGDDEKCDTGYEWSADKQKCVKKK